LDDIDVIPILHGQVGWMPRLPAAGAGRKADPIIISSFPGSPALWAGSFTLLSAWSEWESASKSHRIESHAGKDLQRPDPSTKKGEY